MAYGTRFGEIIAEIAGGFREPSTARSPVGHRTSIAYPDIQYECRPGPSPGAGPMRGFLGRRSCPEGCPARQKRVPPDHSALEDTCRPRCSGTCQTRLMWGNSSPFPSNPVPMNGAWCKKLIPLDLAKMGRNPSKTGRI
jgi:hypothetical protein